MPTPDPHNAVVHWLEPDRNQPEVPPLATAAPLDGRTFAVKDVIDVAGVRATLGSNVPVHTEPATTSAEVVRRLEAAGARCIATTNCQEFSYGIIGDESAHGRSINPINADLVTGGSSMGSAILVATGAVDLAVGTDTAGSVRVPAACTGVIGFKPTLGSISTAGVFPLAQSFDTVGFFGREVDLIESALLASAIDPDRFQPEQHLPVANQPISDHAGSKPGTPSPPRGTVRPHTTAQCQQWDAALPPVDVGLLARAWPGAADLVTTTLSTLGLTSTDANATALTELLDQTGPIYTVMRRFESFGVHQPWIDRYPECYQPGVRAKIEAGRQVTASDYDRQYRVLSDLRLQALRQVPDGQLLITPAIAGEVPTWDEATNPEQSGRDAASDLVRYTMPWNVLGWPAVVLPTPITAASGVPVAIQVVGRPDADRAVLALARELLAHF